MSADQTPKTESPRNAEGVTVGEIYKEQYAHFRGMNDTLYKIPPLFTAVIGGLWYFAVQNLDEKKGIASAVFIFAAIASLAFVNIMSRFRQAFSAYIGNLNRLDCDLKVSTKGGAFRVSAITTVQIILWVAVVMSIMGALYPWRNEIFTAAARRVVQAS